MASRRTRRLLAEGDRAPDFRLPRLDGGETSLQELTAKGDVLLAFFKVTCPVCQLTFPVLERLHKSGSLPIYGISQNDAEDTRDFNREFGITLPVLLDPEEGGFTASNAYGISTVPTLFLVGRDGAIVRVSEGWSRKDIEWLGSRAGTNPFRPGDRYPEFKAG